MSRSVQSRGPRLPTQTDDEHSDFAQFNPLDTRNLALAVEKALLQRRGHQRAHVDRDRRRPLGRRGEGRASNAGAVVPVVWDVSLAAETSALTALVEQRAVGGIAVPVWWGGKPFPPPVVCGVVRPSQQASWAEDRR